MCHLAEVEGIYKVDGQGRMSLAGYTDSKV